jgi:hypothetical protein
MSALADKCGAYGPGLGLTLLEPKTELRKKLDFRRLLKALFQRPI